MKALALVLVLAAAACGNSSSGATSGSGAGASGSGSSSGGSSSGSTTGGGCAQALCGGACCTSNQVCLTDLTGQPICATPCITSSDCVGRSPPCCQPSRDSNGNFAKVGICTDGVSVSTCLCTGSDECIAQYECAPATNYGSTAATGHFTGAYICTLDDGRSFDGCDGFVCDQPTQSCTTDKHGNQFCADPCGADADCGNPGVACCDDPCDAGLTCCGLCGH